MKKYFLHILILIAVMGIFTPLFHAQAITAGTPCTLAGGAAGFWTWSSTTNKFVCVADTSSPGAPVDDPTAGNGTCITTALVDGEWEYNHFSDITYTACQAKIPSLGKGGSVEWTANGIPVPSTDQIYHFLSPLPCDMSDNTPGCTSKGLETFDPTQKNNLSSYLNLMIKIFIGLAAVLAMIMIIIGGVQYMTSELLESKAHGKEKIKGAIFGLILALCAYPLLNQINPHLFDADLSSLKSADVLVTLDQANFSKTEQSATTVGTNYALNGSPSSGVSSFVNNNCTSLSSITVNTSSRQANFCSGTNCVSVPVNLGYNGVAEVGQAQSGDSKTPKGTYTIGGDVRIGSGGNAVISGNGYNLGAAFINIGATINGSDRGIGFHGSANDTLGTTNGCIRMSNDDLALLSPCMKAGTAVTIN